MHLRAIRWIVPRLLLDFAAAALAYGFAPQIQPEIIRVLVVAGGAPAILRAQIFSIGGGQHPARVGPAFVFEPLFRWLDDKIDDIGASDASTWINDRAVPGLMTKFKLPDLENRALTYIKARNSLDEASKEKKAHSITTTLAASDTDVSPEKKYRHVVDVLLTIPESQGFIDGLLPALPKQKPWWQPAKGKTDPPA